MTTRNHQGFPAQPGAAPEVNAELESDGEDERGLPAPEDPDDEEEELPF